MELLKNKRAVFHIHTCYSHDSLNNPLKIVDYLYLNNIQLAVITDHNSIKGALIARDYAKKKYGDNFEVIIGEEISTNIGDIIAFPLSSLINTRDINQVIIEAKKQNAYLCLPHPYEHHNLFTIHTSIIIENIDFVEIINSRTNKSKNDFAIEYASHFNKKNIVGVDGHLMSELHNNFNIFNENMDNNFVINKMSNKRNIRLSQIITYYKKLDIIRILKYILLYLINI